MTKQHFQYAPGDQVQDLTFDPSPNGIVVSKHDKPDVRLNGGANDVVIHARNLKKV
jgi:hypothetical protein